MKVCQMVFCILACLCAAAMIPSAVFLGWYCLLFAVGGVIFAAAMYWCKKRAEPKQEEPDFFRSEEENDRIRRQREDSGEDRR